jgi:hypothetical protein
VNRDETKNILLRYRPDSADAGDPEIHEALEVAAQDSELARWFEGHSARQRVIRESFRQIAPPPGLKEQITSEHAASLRAVTRRRPYAWLAAAAGAALLAMATIWFARRGPGELTLAAFQNKMVGAALRIYNMDLQTADPARIQTFLREKSAPSDFTLPDGLKRVAESGCAIQSWPGGKVSMLCFRTGKPLPQGTLSDLWLFVVDQNTVSGAPIETSPRFAKVNRLITATWSQGGRLYFLGMEGSEQELKKFVL